MPQRAALTAVRYLFFAFALALMAGCGRDVPALPKLAPDAVVLAFGDSLTSGTGASEAESYPAVLERLVGRRVVRAGVPGETTDRGLARLPGVLDEVEPQLLILIHGGNDFLRKMDEAKTAANLRAMVRAAQDRGVSVVLLGVPKPSLMPSAAGLYADIAGEYRLPYDADTLKRILSDNALKSDPIHPNAKGYAELAEAVARLLTKARAL